jgi:hypothetical protein
MGNRGRFACELDRFESIRFFKVSGRIRWCFWSISLVCVRVIDWLLQLIGVGQSDARGSWVRFMASVLLVEDSLRVSPRIRLRTVDVGHFMRVMNIERDVVLSEQSIADQLLSEFMRSSDGLFT